MAEQLMIKKQVSASIPSKYGLFELSLFTTNQDNKEHLLLTYGKVINTENLLVRIHSECITGDILGSLRCDCGEQLQLSMSQITVEGCGIIIYLRQEGRGIGLIEKLKSYNLQDLGKDTVDANLALGYKGDERSYEVAALILKDLQVKSLRLMTNNPKKIEALTRYDLKVTARVPIKASIHSNNAFYLLTKTKKMKHFFEEDYHELCDKCVSNVKKDKPVVTLAFAQSLDGSIAHHKKDRLILSSTESLVMTHKLRSENAAILVGVGTVIADDPLLTVRHYKGENPQVVVLDSKLRIPTTVRILNNNPKPPIIFTTEKADPDKKKILIDMHAKVETVNQTRNGKVDLDQVLSKLFELGIKTLMVEGGRSIITSFVKGNYADYIIITLAPFFVGGLSVLSQEMNDIYSFPKLKNILQYKLGRDIIIMGEIERN